MSAHVSARKRARLALVDAALRAWRACVGPRPPLRDAWRVLDLGVEDASATLVARDVFGRLNGFYGGCDIWESRTFIGIFDHFEVADAREVMRRGERWDVVLACELVEHMPKADGVELLRRARQRARLVVATAPLGWMPQGAIGGNPYEEHVSAWEPVDFEVEGFTVYAMAPALSVGVYVATDDAVDWRG